jgi:RNase P subunit RPR2
MPRQLPTVVCPGCNMPMTPSDDLTPLPSTNGLQEVSYACQSCGATTVRTMKVDEE